MYVYKPDHTYLPTYIPILRQAQLAYFNALVLYAHVVIIVALQLHEAERHGRQKVGLSEGLPPGSDKHREETTVAVHCVAVDR